MDNDIIIIDDKINEVEILIKEFSKNKIPIKYFNGDLEELPEKPNFSPKVVFLDLYLEDGVRKPKIIFGRCIGILEKLLYPNSEYILCIWTSNIEDYKKEDLLSKEKFDLVLETKKIKPIEIILLEDKKISLDSQELGKYTKQLIKDHSEIIFRIKSRGKILELAIDIEKELDNWIIKNIIHNEEEIFYKEILLNANVLDFMKKFKILKKYYEFHKEKIPDSINLKDIKEFKITGIRNSFAHQEVTEDKITLFYGTPKEYELTYKQVMEWIDFFNSHIKILKQLNSQKVESEKIKI